MLRNRLLILLGVSFIAASAAWADDVGYVDCSNRSEDTQVFGKPRKTPEVVASVPCGERFTILVYGFVFSRIQTGDGKVGYVYSNLIAVDRAATTTQQAGTVQMAAAKTKVPSTRTPAAAPAPAVSAQSQPAPAQSAPTPAPVPTSTVSETTVTAAPSTSLPPQPQSAPAQSLPAPVPEPASPAAVSKTAEPVAAVVQPASPAPAQLLPMPPQPASAPVPEPVSPSPVTNAPEAAASVAQPIRNAPKEPESAPAEPATPSIRPATDRATWEKPLPSMRRRAPLLEVYGGYSFARLAGAGGTSSNMNGGMGSVGWNVKSWLQLVGDSSYSFVTSAGVKNVLYGNHFGARYFHRSRNRWGLTPFAEALVGGSRSDTIVSGTGGYTTSVNSLSYKAGGGVDIHPSRHIDIRLFDVDYYRTSFGTNLHQNNYWASTGIVLRLFGRGSE